MEALVFIACALGIANVLAIAQAKQRKVTKAPTSEELEVMARGRP